MRLREFFLFLNPYDKDDFLRLFVFKIEIKKKESMKEIKEKFRILFQFFFYFTFDINRRVYKHLVIIKNLLVNVASDLKFDHLI
jgi:hypothetical protein